MYEILFIVCFALLFTLNYRRERTLLAPASLFTLTWLGGYFCLILGGDFFFPVGLEANAVYLLGAIAFSIGCLWGRIDVRLPIILNMTFTESNPVATRRLLCALLLICVLLLPFYLYRFFTQVGASSTFTYLAEARYLDLERQQSGPQSFDLVNNFSVISFFVCLCIFYMNEGFKQRRWETVLSIFIAIAYNLASGSKQIAITLPLSLFFITAVRTRQIHISSLILMFVFAAPVFIGLMYLVNYQYLSYNFSTFLNELVRSFLGYLSGGMASFQYVLQDPSLFENNHTIWRFFLETAKSLGFEVQVPYLHARYSFYSNNYDGNVYTIYFSYFKDYGVIGVVILMAGLGCFLTWAYRQMCAGKILFTFLYARFCLGIVLSLNAENFFLGLNNYLKLVIFLLAVYHLPSILYRVSQRRRDIVHA